eukprot:GHVU01218277.1.p4 GENE.GHVU01218277.1~~GHVU01218277.1.p4  ORF type:complete len:111 (-),score=0.91 GHVU01218277.1:768-1100(-)
MWRAYESFRPGRDGGFLCVISEVNVSARRCLENVPPLPAYVSVSPSCLSDRNSTPPPWTRPASASASALGGTKRRSASMPLSGELCRKVGGPGVLVGTEVERVAFRLSVP